LTGNNKEIIKRYNQAKRLNGLVGPIVGVSGLLVGLANNVKIPAINIMAETLGHPNYMGIRGAKEILYVLENKLNLGLNLKRLNREIKDLQDGLSQLEDIEGIIPENIKEEKEFDKSYLG